MEKRSRHVLCDTRECYQDECTQVNMENVSVQLKKNLTKSLSGQKWNMLHVPGRQWEQCQGI